MISNQKFSLVDPKTNMALSVRDSAPAGVVHANVDRLGHNFRFDLTEWTEYFGSFTASGDTVTGKQCRGGETGYTGEIYAL